MRARLDPHIKAGAKGVRRSAWSEGEGEGRGRRDAGFESHTVAAESLSCAPTLRARGGIRIRTTLALFVLGLIAPVVAADDWLATDPAGDDALQPLNTTTPCHDASADLLRYDARRDGSEIVLALATLGSAPGVVCAGAPIATSPITRWVDVTLTDATPGNGVRSLTAHVTTSGGGLACVSMIPESGAVRSTCTPAIPGSEHAWRTPASGDGWSLVGATVTVKAYAIATHAVGTQTLTFNDRGDAVPTTL